MEQGTQESTSGLCPLSHWAPYLFLKRVRVRKAFQMCNSLHSGRLKVRAGKPLGFLNRGAEERSSMWPSAHWNFLSTHKMDQAEKEAWCVLIHVIQIDQGLRAPCCLIPHFNQVLPSKILLQAKGKSLNSGIIRSRFESHSTANWM